MKKILALVAVVALTLTGCGTQTSKPAAPGGSSSGTTRSVQPSAPPVTPGATGATTPSPELPTEAPSPAAWKGLQPPLGEKSDCAKVKCVALTFDDGPGKRTRELVDFLVSEQVPATFFMVGNSVNVNKDVVKHIAHTAGMTIANHTLAHPDLRFVNGERLNSEIAGNAAKLKDLSGVKPKYFRPPYGSYNNNVLNALKKNGEAVIMWDVDTLDWKSKNEDKIMAEVKKQTKRGSIILMHDIHPTTVDSVPRLIRWLKKEGYTAVSLDDLLGDAKPGVVYFNSKMNSAKKK